MKITLEFVTDDKKKKNFCQIYCYIYFIAYKKQELVVL